MDETQSTPPNQPNDPLGESIKLTIREIRFKDSLENAASPLGLLLLGDTAEPLNDFEADPATTTKSHQQEEEEDSRISDQVELNLDGDTNVQAAMRDTTDSHVEVDTALVVAACIPEGVQEEEKETLTSQCTTPSTDRIPDPSHTNTTLVEPRESATLTTVGDEDDEEEKRLTTVTCSISKEQSPLDGDRRSNDLLQVQVAATTTEVAQGVLASSVEEFQQDEATAIIDGLLLLDVERACSPEHRLDNHDEEEEEGDGQVQQAFEVELVEEQHHNDSRTKVEKSGSIVCEDALNSSATGGSAVVVDDVPLHSEALQLNDSSVQVGPETEVQEIARESGADEIKCENNVVVDDPAEDISDAIVVVVGLSEQKKEEVEVEESSLKIRSVNRNSCYIPM